MEHIQKYFMATRQDGSITPCILQDYNRSPFAHFSRLTAAYQLPLEEEPKSRLITNTIGPVTRLAYSPNGETLVFALVNDLLLTLCNARTGEKIAVLEGHTDRVNYVIFNPSGDRIASVSKDYSNDRACLWDAATGKLITTIDLQDDLVTGIAYSCDGKILASSSLNGTIRLWHADSGESIAPPLEHEYCVHGVLFDPKGNQIISHTVSDLYIWDRTTLECQKKLKFLISRVHQIAISPNGEHLVVLGDNGICIWNNFGADEVGFDLHDSNMKCSAFQAAFTSDSKSVLLMNVTIANSLICGFFIYDLAFRVLIPVLNVGIYTYGFSLSQNYSSVAFKYGMQIHIAPVPQLRPITLTVISPNSDIVACVFSEGTIWLGSPREFPVVRKKLEGKVGNVVHLTFTSDNTFLAGVDEEFLYLWDVSTQELWGSASRKDLPPVIDLYFLGSCNFSRKPKQECLVQCIERKGRNVIPLPHILNAVAD